MVRIPAASIASKSAFRSPIDTKPPGRLTLMRCNADWTCLAIDRLHFSCLCQYPIQNHHHLRSAGTTTRSGTAGHTKRLQVGTPRSDKVKEVSFANLATAAYQLSNHRLFR